MQQKLKQWVGHSLSVPTFGGCFQCYMLLSIKQVKRRDVIQWLEAKTEQNQAYSKEVYILKGGGLSTKVVIGSLPVKAFW